MDCSPPGSFVHGILEARTLEVDSHSLLQRIFLIQELNLGLLHCRQILYHLASLVAQIVNHLPTMWETWVRSLGWEDPLEKEMATHSSILSWRISWTV